MNSLDDLDPRYRLILCDIWGVVHDGGTLLPGAAQRLLRWKGEGRTVLLITNAPRSADTVAQGLARLGLPLGAYDAITSSGEAGIAALTSPPRPVGFLGTADDRADLAARGVLLTEDGFTELACTGLNERDDHPDDYAVQLEQLAAADVLLHCLNPDRVVIRSGVREACAGALADLYEKLGGRVLWYGKPHAPIYDHAMALGKNPPKSSVLAVGDALLTDMLGAARYGIDAVYVSHGIHAGEPFPPDFAAQHQLGGWRPVLTVPNLA